MTQFCKDCKHKRRDGFGGECQKTSKSWTNQRTGKIESFCESCIRARGDDPVCPVGYEPKQPFIIRLKEALQW